MYKKIAWGLGILTLLMIYAAPFALAATPFPVSPASLEQIDIRATHDEILSMKIGIAGGVLLFLGIMIPLYLYRPRLWAMAHRLQDASFNKTLSPEYVKSGISKMQEKVTEYVTTLETKSNERATSGLKSTTDIVPASTSGA